MNVKGGHFIYLRSAQDSYQDSYFTTLDMYGKREQKSFSFCNTHFLVIYSAQLQQRPNEPR